MPTIVPINRANALIYRDVRLRALQEAPLAFESTYAREALLTEDDWLARAERWTGPNCAAYLALDGAVTCGLIGCFLSRDNLKQANLVAMWVAPSHRRAGVGSQLIAATHTWAQAKGARALFLLVTCNNAGAISFYEHLGFAKTGTFAQYPNDSALFEYEMSRAIPLAP